MQQLGSLLLISLVSLTASQCDKRSMSCSPLASTQRCIQQLCSSAPCPLISHCQQWVPTNTHI